MPTHTQIYADTERERKWFKKLLMYNSSPSKFHLSLNAIHG